MFEILLGILFMNTIFISGLERLKMCELAITLFNLHVDHQSA